MCTFIIKFEWDKQTSLSIIKLFFKKFKKCVIKCICFIFQTSIFDNSFVKESFSAAIKKREGFDRKIVWTCIIAIALQVVIIQGHLQISYMFSNIRLGWNITDFSIFASTVCTLSIVGSMSMVKFVKFIGSKTIAWIFVYMMNFTVNFGCAFSNRSSGHHKYNYGIHINFCQFNCKSFYNKTMAILPGWWNRNTWWKCDSSITSDSLKVRST